MTKSPEKNPMPSAADKKRLKIAARLARELMKIIGDNKGENLTTIELFGKSDLADYLLIATGTSRRHRTSLSEYIARALKEKKHDFQIEGLPNADWIIIDAGLVIAHIFSAETRAYYQLERMWEL